MTNVAWTNVAWTNVAWADVAWTNVLWIDIAWTNGTGPLIISQGWIHKLEMATTVLSLGGLGLVKVETKAISVQQAGTGTELGNNRNLCKASQNLWIWEGLEGGGWSGYL